jgi:hypothetical protein
MPAADVLARIPRVHTLNQILEAKKRWSVSTMAMIYRLHALKVISDWQYRMFCIQASDLGYGTSEPFASRSWPKTRVRLLAGIEDLPWSPCILEASSDAELFRLREEFDRVHAEWTAQRPEHDRHCEAFQRAWARARLSYG